MVHSCADNPLQIGIPACDELAWLPQTLQDLAAQTDLGFEVWICVNHEREAFRDKAKQQVVLENSATVALLRQLRKTLPFPLHILDATGEGAPIGDEAGVGWARRQLFGAIFEARGMAAIGVSLDADTRVAPNYVAALRAAFEAYPKALGCALPYYHELPDDPVSALQLLRYEIYLRYYHINLWRIGSPHALTALGSALAFRGRAYTGVGGFPLRQAGEDFYLLQRLRKMGPIISWLPTRVCPASRVSRRVPFGTGILLEPGAMDVLEQRFPFYAIADFEVMGATFAAWPAWYESPKPVSIQAFLDTRMGGDAPFLRMRRNAKNSQAFVRACHGRFDGLKLLQCLRYLREEGGNPPSASSQIETLLRYQGEVVSMPEFEVAHLGELANIRDSLWTIESQFQKDAMSAWPITTGD